MQSPALPHAPVAQETSQPSADESDASAKQTQEQALQLCAGLDVFAQLTQVQTQTQTHEEIETIVLDNPLAAFLTPGVNRRSIPTSDSPKRVLTSQDSKVALFGNLFGPMQPPAAPTEAFSAQGEEEKEASGLVQGMQAFNLKTDQNGMGEYSDEEHE
jgi:hypothetical protein